MEKFIEEINQIMSPYYDYTEKNKKKNNFIISEINRIRKKISEIDNGEKSRQLELLKEKLNSLMEEFNKNIKYRKVYVKEMIEIKISILDKLEKKKNGILEFQNNLKKQRFNIKKEISQIENNYMINRQKLELELHELNEKVEAFTYEYDENNRSINDDVLDELFNKIKMLINEIERMENFKPNTTEVDELDKIINLLQKEKELINKKENEIALNKEELKINDMEFSKLEQQEYDRRRGVKIVEEDFATEEGIPVIEEYTNTSNVIYEPVIFDNQDIVKVNNKKQESNISYDLGDLLDFKVSISGNNTTVKTEEELYNQMYLDIKDNFDNLNSIKIDNKGYISTNNNSSGYILNENIKLKARKIGIPVGEYLNLKDIEDALDKYFIKEKDRNYILDNKIYKLSYPKFEKLRNEINKCNMIAFVRQKKSVDSNIYALYGKTASDKNISIIDNIRVEIKEGFYINVDDFKKILYKILVKTKKMNNNVEERKFKLR